MIEPTGLGHPKQILALLTGESYRPWLTLQATLCLLDARQLNQPRYTENENFRDQLAAADIIVANKQETYLDADLSALRQWQSSNGDNRQVVLVSQGEVGGSCWRSRAIICASCPTARIITRIAPRRGWPRYGCRGRILASFIESGPGLPRLRLDFLAGHRL